MNMITFTVFCIEIHVSQQWRPSGCHILWHLNWVCIVCIYVPKANIWKPDAKDSDIEKLFDAATEDALVCSSPEPKALGELIA